MVHKKAISPILDSGVTEAVRALRDFSARGPPAKAFLNDILDTKTRASLIRQRCQDESQAEAGIYVCVCVCMYVKFAIKENKKD